MILIMNAMKVMWIAILVLGIEFDVAVPRPTRWKLKGVSLAWPFQNLAVVFGNISAAKAEQQGVDGGVFERSENQRYKLFTGQRTWGFWKKCFAPSMNDRTIAIEQKTPRGRIRDCRIETAVGDEPGEADCQTLEPLSTVDRYLHRIKGCWRCARWPLRVENCIMHHSGCLVQRWLACQMLLVSGRLARVQAIRSRAFARSTGGVRLTVC